MTMARSDFVIIEPTGDLEAPNVITVPGKADSLIPAPHESALAHFYRAGDSQWRT